MVDNWLAIPAVAFVGENSGVFGADYNSTGTACHLTTRAFAPVYLPHGATVVALHAGARSQFDRQVAITLRRNETQQENVDVVEVITSLEKHGFEFMDSSDVQFGVIDNFTYNYYLVADIRDPHKHPPTRSTCSMRDKDNSSLNFCLVASCHIRYRL